MTNEPDRTPFMSRLLQHGYLLLVGNRPFVQDHLSLENMEICFLTSYCRLIRVPHPPTVEGVGSTFPCGLSCFGL